jgi:ATP-dependent protease ClpP protease subunit
MRRLTKQEYFKSFKNQAYVEQLQRVERKFETIRNESAGYTELTIYGLIGDSYWEDSVSALDIDNALKSITGDIVIHLNSPGGDAFDGITIYNRLKKHDGKVTVNVDGWACSAASVLAMAADELVMGLGSMIMIHEASSIVWGTKTEMRKEADVLDELEEGIIDIYMTKANVSREEIRSAVDAETWYGAQKAIDIGFATSTVATDGKDKEITQLRAQLASMKNEIQQLKVTPKDEPKPAAAAAPRFIF